MQGKGYIKVASVIFIIGGILALIIYPIGGLLLGWATVKTGENMGWALVVICLLYTVGALIQFMAGFRGMKDCESREAVPTLKKYGIAVMVIAVLAAVVNFIQAILNGDSMVTSLIGIVVGFVFPAIYLYGVSLNSK